MIAPVVSSGSMTAAMRIGPDYGSVLGAYQLAGDRPLAAFFIVAVIPGSSSSRMAPSRSAVAEVASSLLSLEWESGSNTCHIPSLTVRNGLYASPAVKVMEGTLPFMMLVPKNFS